MIKILRSQHLNTGLTLLEMLVALSVSAAIITTVITFVYIVINTNREDNEVTNLSELVEKIEGIYGTSHRYGGLTEKSLLEIRAVPVQMMGSGSIKNSWADPGVYVQSFSNGRNYGILYIGLPNKACVDLIAKTKMLNFYAVRVNGDLVFGLDDAVQSCTMNDLNRVAWIRYQDTETLKETLERQKHKG